MKYRKLLKKSFSAIMIASLLSGCAAKTEDVTAELPDDAQVLTESNAKKIESNENEQAENEQAENEQTENEQTENEQTENEQTENAAYEEIDYQEVEPYEVGQIMILMYHGLVEADPQTSYQRSYEDFYADLENLYNGGYRLIPLGDLLRNEIKVAAGYTPVVMTFDDGLSSSFSLSQADDGTLVPAENCAVEILDRFAKEHPDFGNTATFHINGDSNFFAGEGTKEERLQYLIEHGHDVGNHTYSHLSLLEAGAEEVQAEIGQVDQMIRELLPDYEPLSVAYPYGHRPESEAVRPLVLSGVYNGKSYAYQAALRVGQSGTPAAPNRKDYDPLNLPRVRGSDDEETDLGWQLRYYEENPEYRYISDGNPQRIAVPTEYAENVAQDSLDGWELYLY